MGDGRLAQLKFKLKKGYGLQAAGCEDIFVNVNPPA